MMGCNLFAIMCSTKCMEAKCQQKYGAQQWNSGAPQESLLQKHNTRKNKMWNNASMRKRTLLQKGKYMMHNKYVHMKSGYDCAFIGLMMNSTTIGKWQRASIINDMTWGERYMDKENWAAQLNTYTDRWLRPFLVVEIITITIAKKIAIWAQIIFFTSHVATNYDYYQSSK
jgi:hypothetical protein